MNNDVHHAYLNDRTVHWLLEYFLAVPSGEEDIAARRAASEIAGQEPDWDILQKTAAAIRADQRAKASRAV